MYFEGDLPANVPEREFGVYYLPGTSGWAGFGGAPFNLEIKTPAAALGNEGGSFGFSVGAPGGAGDPGAMMFAVEACADLTRPVWARISTNTLDRGSFAFTDRSFTNSAARFYRVRMP